MMAHGIHNLMERTGLALFGTPWRANLCALLDVSSRTLRRWVEDPATVPPRVWYEIEVCIIARQATLSHLRGETHRLGPSVYEPQEDERPKA